jgi:hypothetical protein
MRISICRVDGASENTVKSALEHLSRAGLCATECARLRGVRNIQARAASVGARLALLWALTDGQEGLSVHELGDHLPAFVDKPLASLARAESGAPLLTGQGRTISFAHSDRLALCALSTKGRVGVDVEPLDRRIARAEDIAARYFSDGEQALLARANDRDRAFLGIWTRKEALGKALGTGLNNAAAALDTTAYPADCFSEYVVDGALVSVCVLGEVAE